MSPKNMIETHRATTVRILDRQSRGRRSRRSGAIRISAGAIQEPTSSSVQSAKLSVCLSFISQRFRSPSASGDDSFPAT